MVSCSAFIGIYMTTVVFCHILVSIKNYGRPHRNCSLTRVIRVPSTFLPKL